MRMGQYYRALILKEKNIRKPNKYGCLPSPECKPMAYSPLDYDNLYKLLEWSYIGNSFLDTVLTQLIRPLDDKKKRLLAFVGDYSELKENVKIPKDLKDYRYCINAAHEMVWNMYGEKAISVKGANRSIDTYSGEWYAVDRTAHEYVKLFDLPLACPGWDGHINPVGILCATSNGLGGGDYRGHVNEDMAGRWAFHDIVVTAGENIDESYLEIKPDFTEE